MENEILNPHGGGIYGHRYYECTRGHVEFLIQANNEYTGNYAKFIDTILDDGGIIEDISCNWFDYYQ